MASNYDELTRINIRRYGEEVEHLKIYEQLYADRTHFILELLQNAEDAEASTVTLSLYSDRFEAEHDGRRLFSEDDVRSICSIAHSTKATDLTKIGKFGIGFKSVYAYTASPEVHCGNEHFSIEYYIRPQAAATIPVGNKTLFRLPFNHASVSAKRAFNDIQEKFRKIEPLSILFLKNIQRINWSVNGVSVKTLSRSSEPMGPAMLTSLKTSDKTSLSAEVEHWLVFSRVSAPVSNKPVEIAVRLQKNDSGDWRVQPVESSPLVVFFPTDRETDLGFIVQGPYRTTPARDNVPGDNPENQALVEITGDLLREVFDGLVELGLMNVQCLEMMPLNQAKFPSSSMLRPIYDSTIAMLSSGRFIPNSQGFSS